MNYTAEWRESSIAADKKKKPSQTRDKEIPFVRNGHSALFQRNQLTEQVGLWVSAEIMPLWWWWVKNMMNRILSLFDLSYLWDIQYGAWQVGHNPKDRGCKTDTRGACTVFELKELKWIFDIISEQLYKNMIVVFDVLVGLNLELSQVWVWGSNLNSSY